MKKEKYFEVGQTVYCATFGKGLVVSITFPNVYPIAVEFGGISPFKLYTFDGRYDSTLPVTLSQKPLSTIVNEPLCEFKKGDVVLVRDSDEDFWGIAIFFKVSNNGYYLTSTTGIERDCLSWNKCISYDAEIIKEQSK